MRYQITALKDLTVRALVWAEKAGRSEKTFRLLTGKTRDDVAMVISVSDKFDPADPFPIIHPEDPGRYTTVAGLLLVEAKSQGAGRPGSAAMEVRDRVN